MEYSRLYELQDEVLQVIAGCQTSFYLGGGTALSRFYLQHRFSDDLDFFSNETLTFAEEVRQLRTSLFDRIGGLSVATDSRFFKRFLLDKNGVRLKIDLIHEVLPRFGRLEVLRGVLVDGPRNILTNKLGAFWGRDEPRDAADLLALARAYRFGWKSILDEAQQKDHFGKEELLLRMTSFPLNELDQVPFLKPRVADEDSRDWAVLRSNLEDERANSLAPSEAREIW